MGTADTFMGQNRSGLKVIVWSIMLYEGEWRRREAPLNSKNQNLSASIIQRYLQCCEKVFSRFSISSITAYLSHWNASGKPRFKKQQQKKNVKIQIWNYDLAKKKIYPPLPALFNKITASQVAKSNNKLHLLDNSVQFQ